MPPFIQKIKRFSPRVVIPITSLAVLGAILFFPFAHRPIDVTRQATAEGPQDLSSSIAFFNSGQSAAVTAIAGNKAEMLFGGGSQTHLIPTPKLGSYKAGMITDLSNKLANFGEASVETIGFNGAQWLIGGGNASSNRMTPRLNLYNGSTFTDISPLFTSYIGHISAIAWNGSYWLLGITLPAETSNEQSVVVRYNGTAITEIISSKTAQYAYLKGAAPSHIEWNGQYWLVAYASEHDTNPPALNDSPQTRLFKYDGQKVTALYPTQAVTYSILDAAWNGKEWLVANYLVGVKTNLQTYDGTSFHPFPAALPPGLLAVSVAWVGDYWVLGTVSDQKNYTAGLLISSPNYPNTNAVQFWKFDGTSLTPLAGFPQGPLVKKIFFEQDEGRLFIGGMGQNYHALFAIELLDRLPQFADGTLVQAAGHNEIFVIFHNKKKHVPSAQVFASYGYSLTNVRQIDFDTLTRIPDLRLLRVAGDPKVWALDRGQKRWIKTVDAFNSYGFSWDDVLTVNALDLGIYRTARLIRPRGEQDVYYITGGGLRRHIPTPQVFVSYGNHWEDVVEVTLAELYSYPPNDLIRKEGDYRIWRLENGMKRWIKTAAAFTRLKFDYKKIALVNATELAAYPEGPPIQ